MIRAHIADEAGAKSWSYSRHRPKFQCGDGFFAADYMSAEVDETMPIGGLDPNHVTIPGTLIDAVVKGG